MVNETAASPLPVRGTGLTTPGLHPSVPGAPVAWRVSDGPVAYEDATAEMERSAQAIADGAPEQVWLLEHPPLYTAGTSAREEDLVTPGRFPVHRTGRGGEFTYHGPGQRVAYVMLDLRRRRQDVRLYVATLEAWIIAVLWRFHVRGFRREDRVGVWVPRPDKAEIAPGVAAEDKIAAIGIRIRKWVTFHGISLNVDPDLEHFSGIVPCGIRGYGVTSLADLGIPVSMPEVDMILREEFELLFGPTAR
ncbi:lipoyl(octanoyl) transferase LipB [Prosthecomicrobium sp. N25]|uniref:lipoyl(octanoyl) transferase LipB n=1 Tax=Prosthecomicrobium sp. N25 TaxID=3129254 RepID=UPI00307879B8